MKHASIARKMAVSYAVLVAVSAAVAAFMLHQTGRLAAGIERSGESQTVLRELEGYRGALLEVHKTMLRLVNSSDMRHIDALEAAFSRHDEERAAVGGLLDTDPPSMLLLSRIDALVDRWREDVVARQLQDVQDPFTVDVARLRESSLENSRLWEGIGSAFEELAGMQYARMRDTLSTKELQLVLMQVASGGSALVLLFMCVLMALVTHRSVASPLHRLAAITERLRDRDWGVEVTEGDRRDEIGRMARALEVFRDNGRRQAELEASQKAAAEERLAAAEEVRRAVAEFRSGAQRLLGELGGAGTRLDHAATTLHDVVGTSHTYTRTVTEAAEASGTSVQNVAAAIEEMSLSIRDVSGQIQTMSGLSRRTAEASAEAGRKVLGLKERSARIHDVVDLINGIAGQINLLALNATIESARAGAAGKGFAVVAQQVKQLADETGRATEDIARVIDEVAVDVGAVVAAIESIERAIGEVNASSATVAAAVEEQSTALDEISRNVANVSNQTSEVAGNVRGVETKVQETFTVADDVRHLSENLRTSRTELGRTIETFIGKVANDSNGTAHAA